MVLVALRRKIKEIDSIITDLIFNEQLERNKKKEIRKI